MNKIKFFAASISLVILSSCSSTPEEACDCIKNAANQFMLQGTLISNIDDLREPCQEIIDDHREDPAARALITDCGNEVFEALERKELFQIDEPLDFETKRFSTVTEFIDFVNNLEIKNENDKYKYHNLNINIESCYFFTESRSDKKCNIGPGEFEHFSISDDRSGDPRGWNAKSFSVRADSSIKKRIYPSLDFYTNNNVVDIEGKFTMPLNSRSYMSNLADLYLKYKFRTIGWYYDSDEVESLLNKLANECLHQEVEMRFQNGGYRVLSDDEVSRLAELYGDHYSMSKGSFSGVLKLYNTERHIWIEDLKVEQLELPEEINEGEVINFNEIMLEMSEKGSEMEKTQYSPFY